MLLASIRTFTSPSSNEETELGGCGVGIEGEGAGDTGETGTLDVISGRLFASRETSGALALAEKSGAVIFQSDSAKTFGVAGHTLGESSKHTSFVDAIMLCHPPAVALPQPVLFTPCDAPTTLLLSPTARQSLQVLSDRTGVAVDMGDGGCLHMDEW